MSVVAMEVVLLRLGPAVDTDASRGSCLLLLFLLLLWLSTGEIEFVPPCFGVCGASGGRAPRGALLTFFSLLSAVVATGRSRSTADTPVSLVGVRRMVL